MNDQSTYYFDLITRYFSGETPEAEIAELSDWLEKDEENQKTFDEFRKSWLAVEQLSIQKNVDTDKEWKIFSNRINGNIQADKKETKIIAADFSKKKSRKIFYTIVSIAAILAIVCISSVIIFNNVNKPVEMTLIAGIENKDEVLPDGSHVTLSPGTTLSYKESKDKETRQVELKGEAYFEVTHDAEKPFIVSAGENVRVEVLGTIFCVNTNAPGGNIDVVLKSGKISVYYIGQENHAIILNSGEHTSVPPVFQNLTKNVNNDENYLAWKTGKLVFADTPLDELVRLLNKTYNADVRLADPAIGNCLITATFENQTLDAVLNVVKETLSLEIKRKGKVITISGTACN